MNKLIIFCLLSFFSGLALAEIQVQVDPSQIMMGESFQLTLSQDNPQNAGLPDLTVLQQDFAILGTERQVNYSIINGQAQSSNQWVITLKPLKTGIVTIPAIKLGTEQSSPVTINVGIGTSKDQTDPTDDTQQQDSLLIAETDVTKPYINQQIIYTVKIYNRKRLLDSGYEGPKVDNAILIPLGDARRYQTVLNNTNYIVDEIRYAIFPQKSGTLDIISPTFTAVIYDFNPQRIKVQAKTLSVTVQPIPKKYQSKSWLPAKTINLSDHYESASQNVNQGSTLTRTISVEGVGIPAQLLPTFKFADTDVLSVYPEKGADRNLIKQNELVGSTEIKVTYLFNKSGKVTIPELRVPWFNTVTGKNELAVLPPRTLDITASASTSQMHTKPGNNVQEQIINQSRTDIAGSADTKTNWGWIVALLFALAWLATVGLWGWQKRGNHSGSKKYKNALNELKNSCNQCNPERARDVLLKWATLHWPDATILNLTDLTRLVRDPQLKKQVHLLSQVLYQREEKTLWRGDELLRAVLAEKRGTVEKNPKASVLPPINPF